MTTAQPGNSSSAFSKEDSVSTSRSLVGSSSRMHVAADLQRQRQVEPVALATGEHPGRLLLVRALEAERRHVGPRGHLHLADHQVVQPVGDDLPHRLLRIEAGPSLVHIGQLYRLADPDRAGVRLLQPDDGLEQGGLADAVGADDADDSVAGQGERQVADQHPVVEALGQVVRLDDRVAQPRARRDLDLLEVELAGLLRLGGHLLVAVQPGPGLGLPGLRRWTVPTRALR